MYGCMAISSLSTSPFGFYIGLFSIYPEGSQNRVLGSIHAGGGGLSWRQAHRQVMYIKRSSTHPLFPQGVSNPVWQLSALLGFRDDLPGAPLFDCSFLGFRGLLYFILSTFESFWVSEEGGFFSVGCLGLSEALIMKKEIVFCFLLGGSLWKSLVLRCTGAGYF